MKHVWIWIAACMLFLSLYGEQVMSQIQNEYEWTIEPHTDGSAHIKMRGKLGIWSDSWAFTAKESNIKNLKAYEAETKTPIQVKKTKVKDRTKYTFEFRTGQQGGFEFIVEYDELERVSEYKNAYYIYLGWTFCQNTLCKASFILPKGHELISTKYSQPSDVSEQGGQVTVVAEQEVKENKSFEIGVTFSDKGVKSLNEAENNYRMKDYENAKKAYQDAYDFYSQFEELYNRDIDEFLDDIKGFIQECSSMIEEERIETTTAEADQKFQEALESYNNGEYEEALKTFKEALKLYYQTDNSEKADQCQDYINECGAYLEEEEAKEEAEQLFAQGMEYYNNQQYTEAKTAFEQALEKYKEAGDEQKVKECEEWIKSCEEPEEPEEEKNGTCLGSFIVFLLLACAVLLKYD
ncbi:MAG: tetratricopeptide repeat protein [Candidatus Methanofastidiosia archaeon]|jgi:tetratricopeptide (TPR) repeat protein